mmetsp:Transcript_82810/g.162343  ORF Transcript_82810/g.162343 Transcript_82810/m.162343 type:complete len:363 (+) Transcript_82810:45-1133(+)
MTSIVCQFCNSSFESRNKLFKHVRACSTGAIVSREAVPCTHDSNELFLYVVGGRQRGRTLGSVEKYSFQTNKWEDCPLMMEQRGSHGAACANGILYAVGGGGFRSNLSSCESFDGKAWKSSAPLQVSRHALAVVEASGDKIYAVGGWIDGKECSAVVEKFSPETNVWSSVASLNQARRLHGVASFFVAGQEDQLFAFGGNCDEPHWHTNTAEKYDPVTDKWSYISPMPAAGGASAASIQPFVFVFLHGKYVMRYDPKEDTYVRLSDLPLPEWHCFDVVSVPNSTHILALGGVTNGRWCKNVYRYDASNDSWLQLPSMRTARRRCASAIVSVPASSAETPSESPPTANDVHEGEPKKQKTDSC